MTPSASPRSAEELEALEKMLAGAKEGSRELDYQVHEILIDDNARLWNVPAHTTSLDAAFALMIRALPGRCFRMTRYSSDGSGVVSIFTPAGTEVEDTEAPTPVLAVVLALIRALARPEAEER